MGLSSVFGTKISKATSTKTKDAIFRLLISSKDESLKIYLEAGLTRHLIKIQPDFVRDCWNGILFYINEIDKVNIKERKKEDGFNWSINRQPTAMEKLEKSKWLKDLIRSVLNGTIMPPKSINPSLQMETHWLLNDAMRIIPYNTSLPQQHEFIRSLLRINLDFLNDPSQQHKYDFHENRDALKFFYARYLLALPQEVAAVYFTELINYTLIDIEKPQTEEHIKFVRGLIQEHIRAVNDNSSVANFWALWELLRKWMINNDNGYLFSLFLMTLDWNESSNKWHVLSGKNLYFKEFISNYGFNQIDVSIKFLSGIAFHDFMPDSISWVATMLTSQKGHEVSIPIAEKFIQKSFYNFGAAIKSDKVLLDDFIFILDFLIAKYSTKAYMLKEELIQYKQVLN